MICVSVHLRFGLLQIDFFFQNVLTSAMRKVEIRKQKTISHSISVDNVEAKNQKFHLKSQKLRAEVLFSRTEAISQNQSISFSSPTILCSQIHCEGFCCLVFQIT